MSDGSGFDHRAKSPTSKSQQLLLAARQVPDGTTKLSDQHLQALLDLDKFEAVFFLKNIQSTWVSHSRRLAVHGAAREEDLRPRLRESLVVGISASLGHNRGPANCSGKHELSLLANQIAPPQILQCLSGTRSLATCNIRAAQEHVRSARNLQMTNWQRPRLPANWLLTLPDRPP